MRTHVLYLVLVLGGLVLFSACSDSSSEGGTTAPVDAEVGAPFRLDTAVDPAQVAAGDPVQCTCSAYDAEDRLVTATGYTLGLNTLDGVTVDGMKLVPTLTGTLEVACQLDGLVDGSPAVVTVLPGSPASTAATVDPNPTPAGETATVTCHVVDIWGNAVEGKSPTVAVVPDDGVDVQGSDLSTEIAGEYEVRCELSSAQANPATWTVVPGEPVTFALGFSPEKLAYAVDDAVQITGVGEDLFGNEVADIPVTDLVVEPGGHHEIVGDGDDTLRFDLEGFYQVSATSTVDASASASRELVVDETGPIFQIKSPDRGMTADIATEVIFSGSVSESMGEVAWLTVNGEEVEIAPEGGDFQATVPLVYGMNFLWAHAADTHGVERVVARSVLWSPDWYALDEPTYETDGVDEGLIVSFNQDGMDDLAEVMASVVSSMDFASALPAMEFDCGLLGGPCALYVSSAKVNPQAGGGPPAELELNLFDGGIHLFMDLYNFELITAIDIPNPLGSFIPIPGIPAVFTTDLALTWPHIQVNMKLYVSMVDGELEVDTNPDEIQIDMGPPPTVQVLDAVPELDPVIDGVLALTVPVVHAAVEVAVPFVAGGLIEGLLGSLTESFAIEEQFELNSLVGDAAPNVINFQTRAQQLQCTEEQMRMSLEGLGFTSEPVPPHEVPGSPMFSGCGPAGTVPAPTHPMVGGLHDDFMNQLLFALWEGGSLTYDLQGDAAAAIDTGDIGITLNALKVDPMLPLMLNSCHGVDTLQVGDLFVDVDLVFVGQPTHLSMWMQLQAELAFSTEVGEDGSHKIVFDIVEFEPFLVEVLENEGIFEGDDVGLAELLSDTLLPLLLDQVAGDALAFEIPTIDLGDISEDIASGTAIQIDIEEMGRSGAYLTFGGALKAVSSEEPAP